MYGGVCTSEFHNLGVNTRADFLIMIVTPIINYFGFPIMVALADFG